MKTKPEKTYRQKYNDLQEVVHKMNQSLHMAVLELAVFRTMAGPVDPMLFSKVAKKMESATFSNVTEFYQAATLAAETTQAELDAVATQAGLQSNGHISLASEADLARISRRK